MNLTIPAAVVGVIAGFAGGYFYAKKKLEDGLASDIQDVKQHYQALRKEDGFDTPEAALRTLYDKVVTDEGYKENTRPTTNDEADVIEDDLNSLPPIDDLDIAHHPFLKYDSDDPDTYFDTQEELDVRKSNPDKPFVLTKDEFLLAEADFEQVTLTYFDKDDVLTDDQDTVVDDVEKTVGYTNLLRFGHASGEPNIVYLRNRNLRLDIELIKDEGSYTEKILGVIEHSDRPRRQMKFRDRD